MPISSLCDNCINPEVPLVPIIETLPVTCKILPSNVKFCSASPSSTFEATVIKRSSTALFRLNNPELPDEPEEPLDCLVVSTPVYPFEPVQLEAHWSPTHKQRRLRLLHAASACCLTHAAAADRDLLVLNGWAFEMKLVPLLLECLHLDLLVVLDS